MKKDIDVLDLIRKAQKSIEAATLLFKQEYYDFSASRSYYAMFYTAEAVLLTKKLSFSKHSAVISAFGNVFIKSNILPQYLHHYIQEAFKLRQIGDYEVSTQISKEQAQQLIEQAKEFIETIKEYLKKETYEI